MMTYNTENIFRKLVTDYTNIRFTNLANMLVTLLSYALIYYIVQ